MQILTPINNKTPAKMRVTSCYYRQRPHFAERGEVSAVQPSRKSVCRPLRPSDQTLRRMARLHNADKVMHPIKQTSSHE